MGVCMWMWACHDACVETEDNLWESVVPFLHMGHQAYPSHRPAVISLVPPVFRKLPFWAANDHASYNLSFSLHFYLFSGTCHSSCNAIPSAGWTDVPLLVSLQILYYELQCCFLSSLDYYLFRSETGIPVQPSGTPGRNLDLSSFVTFLG